MALLTAVVILAIVRAALTALLVVLAVMLLWSFLTRPRETLAFVSTLMLLGLASAQPIAFMATFGIIALAVFAAGVGQKGRLRSGRTDDHRQHCRASVLDRDLLG